MDTLNSFDDLVIEPNDNNHFESENFAPAAAETPVETLKIPEHTENSEAAISENQNEENTKETPKTTEEKPQKSKIISILISIAILLIIAGGAFYIYVFYRDFAAQYIPCLQTQEYDTLIVQQEQHNATHENAENESENTDNQEETTTASDEAVVNAITQSMQAEAKPAEEKTPQTPNNTDFKKTLSRPTWVISVSSVAKESEALKRTKELRTAGKTADYYWIPDYVPGGNAYFKVFVGPFATKADAQNYLQNNDLAADAYVVEVK
ncbi:MAG: SPOR domain-containing protein [Bacteroidales bacterium]|jgi:flagellar basal body-associated protein FliL|nr:SPOR domain-containing protein [Bacteroidales bacterium]